VLSTAPSPSAAALRARPRPSISVRATAFAAIAIAGLWVPIRRSIDDVDSQSPLALVSWALPLAVAVAVHGVRSEPDPTAARPARSADAMIAACCSSAGLACAFFAPRAFGWEASMVRPELLAAPGLLAGWIAAFFGSRALWLARKGIALAVAACPIWYVWLVAPLQRAGIELAWPLLRGLGAVTDVHVTHAAGLRAVGFADGTMVVVGAACAGASSVLGVGLVLTAASCTLSGRVRDKARWVVCGAGLALVGNVVRLLVLVLLGSWVSPATALRFVHPVAGVVLTLAVTAMALSQARRFHLAVPATPPGVLRERLAGCAPRRVAVAVPCALLVALGANVAYASIDQLDRLGGLSSAVNVDGAEVLSQVAADRGLTLLEAEPVAWVEQFYGQATWRRFLLFDPSGTVAAPITVDLTTAAVAESIDRLDLAACYGFHGLAVSHEIGVDALGERPAEHFSFDENGARTEVITWQTRVLGGVQRVVVSQLHGDLASVTSVAAALSTATAAVTVTQDGR
jgi:exosortase/archaeosortase family protein